MKKVVIFSLALVSAASVARAQSTNGVRIGLRVGGTLANIGGKDANRVGGYDGDLNYKLGYNAGLSFQIPLSSDGFWTLAPEVLYNRKGFENAYQITGADLQTSTAIPAGTNRTNLEKFEYENKRVLSYIDVPIPVRVNTAPGGSGLYFELGPQIGYMVASKREITRTYKYSASAGAPSDAKVSEPANKAKEDLASIDIGGVAGLGYQTAGGFSVGVRYNQGFKTLFDTKNVSASNEPKAFNRAFMVQIGYLLPLGK